MARDNNGVTRKVYDNAGQGSIERGSGMAGKEVDQSKQRGLYVTGPAENTPLKMQDMETFHGPKGSSGTVKDNGGVGEMGAGDKWIPFQGEH